MCMGAPTVKQTLLWFLELENSHESIDPSLRGTSVLEAARQSKFIEPGDEDGFANALLELHKLGRIKMTSHTLSESGGELLFRSNLNFELHQVTGMTSTSEGQLWAMNAAALDADASTGADSAAVDGKRKSYGATMTERALPEWPQDRKAVMVVHGRNGAANDAMFAFLKALGLKPLEWSELVKGTGKASPYVGEILDHAFGIAKASVVLFTPDDEAKLLDQFHNANEPPHERVLTPQARANVLFEAGMALAALPDATVLVELGSVRPFSDIYGRHVIRLEGDIEAQLEEIATRLETAGCKIDWDGEWQNVDGFVEALSHVPTADRAEILKQDHAAIGDLKEDMARWMRDRDAELERDKKVRTGKLASAGQHYSGAHINSHAQAQTNALHQYRDEVTLKRRAYRDLAAGDPGAPRFELTDESRAILARWREPVEISGVGGPHEVEDVTRPELEPSIREFESAGDGPE